MDDIPLIYELVAWILIIIAVLNILVGVSTRTGRILFRGLAFGLLTFVYCIVLTISYLF